MEQIKAKIYSLMSEGVDKFPVAKVSPLISVDAQIQIRNISQAKNENDLINTIKNCVLCPLSQSRKKVFVGTKIANKKFFILSEFPQQDEEKKFFASEEIIIKLLEKLGIVEQCYFSFAIKCVPERGIPQNALSVCAKNNLRVELEAVNPEVIFCFGHRALAALVCLDPGLAGVGSAECIKSNFGKLQKETYFLPSSRDLQMFPNWRTLVWKFLEHFKVKNQ